MKRVVAVVRWQWLGGSVGMRWKERGTAVILVRKLSESDGYRQKYHRLYTIGCLNDSGNKKNNKNEKGSGSGSGSGRVSVVGWQ
jgi:uncharacterized membrane protein YgcG